MGSGNIIPRANETRCNSTFRQLRAILALDKTKLNALLRECGYNNLVLTCKDIALLGEVVKILLPFCEATDLTQGDKGHNSYHQLCYSLISRFSSQDGNSMKHWCEAFRSQGSCLQVSSCCIMEYDY